MTTRFRLGPDAHFAIVPAHVKYDSMELDTSSCVVRFKFEGRVVAEMEFNRMAMGDTITIGQLKGEVGLNLN